jgi:hypothetical protein
MDRHGVVALGRDLLDAFCKLETVEHTARIIVTGKMLGGVKELPADEAVSLRSMGLRRYGGPPAAVARAEEPLADLPPEVLQRSTDPWPEPGATLSLRAPDDHLADQPDEVRAMARAIEREVEAILLRRA